jgi:hypothetical protein
MLNRQDSLLPEKSKIFHELKKMQEKYEQRADNELIRKGQKKSLAEIQRKATEMSTLIEQYSVEMVQMLSLQSKILAEKIKEARKPVKALSAHLSRKTRSWGAAGDDLQQLQQKTSSQVNTVRRFELRMQKERTNFFSHQQGEWETMKEEIDELWAKRASEGVGPDLPKPKPMEDKHSITGRKNPFSVLCDGEDEDKVPEGGKDPDKPGAGLMDKRRRRKAKKSQGSFKRKGCSLRLKERKWSRRHCSQESTRESSNPQIGARWRMRNPGRTRRASGILRDTKENTHRRDMKAMRRKMQRVETNLAATPGLPGDWKQYGKNVYYNRRTSRVVEVVPFTEDLRREQEDGGATLALESHQVREDQLIPTLTALLTTESDAQVARMWVDTIHKVIQKAEAQKEVEGIMESLITMATDSGNEIIDEIESMVKTLIHKAADGTEDGKTKNTEATRACTGEAGQ